MSEFLEDNTFQYLFLHGLLAKILSSCYIVVHFLLHHLIFDILNVSLSLQNTYIKISKSYILLPGPRCQNSVQILVPVDKACTSFSVLKGVKFREVDYFGLEVNDKTLRWIPKCDMLVRDCIYLHRQKICLNIDSLFLTHKITFIIWFRSSRMLG